MIPARLIRSVPAETTDEVEQWWEDAQKLHPGWDAVTYRDPIDPADFPITASLWGKCSSGAQRAGLVRLEALLHEGGVWLDSDVEVYRSFAPLLDCRMFAAWEDPNTVPDAVLGAEQGHPAIAACIEMAIPKIGEGAWASGPGVTTAILPNRPDVLLLPPGSFFAVHYTEKDQLDRPPAPWEFARHHWHFSWAATA